MNEWERAYARDAREKRSEYAEDRSEWNSPRLDALGLGVRRSFVRRSQKDGNSGDQRSRSDSDPLSAGDHSITGGAEENRGADASSSR